MARERKSSRTLQTSDSDEISAETMGACGWERAVCIKFCALIFAKSTSNKLENTMVPAAGKAQRPELKTLNQRPILFLEVGDALEQKAF